MKKVKCRVEVYPKESVVPGIRIRIPLSYVKAVANRDRSVAPQLFIRTDGLLNEFGISHLILAIDSDFWLPKDLKDSHRETTSAHNERKVEDYTTGELDMEIDENAGQYVFDFVPHIKCLKRCDDKKCDCIKDFIEEVEKQVKKKK